MLEQTLRPITTTAGKGRNRVELCHTLFKGRRALDTLHTRALKLLRAGLRDPTADFRDGQFSGGILQQIAPRILMFIVDEAHCISDWGHDFRPDYRRIVRVLRLLPGNVLY